MLLLNFVLETTFFECGGKRKNLPTEVWGFHGRIISPIVVNLLDGEQQIIRTALVECQPYIWKRYVDDTRNRKTIWTMWVVPTASNSPMRRKSTGRSIPFLDAKIVVKADQSILYTEKNPYRPISQLTPPMPSE